MVTMVMSPLTLGSYIGKAMGKYNEYNGSSMVWAWPTKNAEDNSDNTVVITNDAAQTWIDGINNGINNPAT